MTIENPVPQGEVLQLTPYNAKYDALPFIDLDMLNLRTNPGVLKTQRDVFSEAYSVLIANALPGLMSKKINPAEITKSELKNWLGSTLMRYHEVPSEIPDEIVDGLEKDLAKVASKQIREFVGILLEIPKQSWGYDDFGKQDPLRQIWENQLMSALSSAGISPEVVASVQELGGIFNMGKTTTKLISIEMINDELTDEKYQDIKNFGAQFSSTAAQKYEEFRNCENYSQRHSMLVALRADVFKYLQDLIALLPKKVRKNIDFSS